jgi:endonuclease YncB( thermonuclease family)
MVISGTASVVDGDTLEVHGQRIRLWGIDAPESHQVCAKDGRAWMCGQKAALALSDFIGRRPVSCATVDRDRYGRLVARCSVAGQDLGAWLARSGWALDFRRYSRGAYAAETAAARRAQVGAWSGQFEAPWDWRREHPR